MLSGFILKLGTADYIQIAILIALIWYSIETHLLWEWQKKSVQLMILGLDMQRIKNHAEISGNPTPYSKKFPIIVREIYELEKFDPKTLYSRAFHRPISLNQKFILWLKNKISKKFRP